MMSSPTGSLGSGGDRRTTARRAWRIVRWALLVLVIAYGVLVIYRIPAVLQQQKSTETVKHIQDQHLTLADVDGTHLPPPPDPAQVDATVAGIDANQNGIRDDVELAIFKKYPDDIKLRAAELQYAITQQLFLTSVSDSATWKAVAEEAARASKCILQRADGSPSMYRDEVESLVFNTADRVRARDKAFEYITSHSVAGGEACDIK